MQQVMNLLILYLNYFLLKRDAVHFMYKNNIHSQSPMLGTWGDQQIPNTFSCYGDFVMETLLVKCYL
jgi:hypothetical protein